MSLTDTKVRALKPGDRPYKRADAGGLYVLVAAVKTDPETKVTTGGAKLWRLNYRAGGKRKTLALGAYPVVTLHEAREQRDAAKKLLRQGLDPGAERKERKAAERQAVTTFKIVGAEWHQVKNIKEDKSANTIYRARWLLDKLDAGIGHRPIAEIEAPELLRVLRKIEAQEKHETVKRLRAAASSVFRYGIATGVCTRDPAADLQGALTAVKATPRAAIVDPVGVGKLLRAVDGLEKPSLRLPLQLLALTFVRPGELCSAEWSEFDLDAGVWSVPASKTKMRVEHRLPLARQALAILKRQRTAAGNGKWVFPIDRGGDNGRPISGDKLNYALRSLGYGRDEVSAHGFRSTASSILNESRKFSVDAIEVSLAHAIPGVRGIYNRARYWDERCKLMQWYADHLDELRNRGEVVSLPGTKTPRLAETGA